LFRSSTARGKIPGIASGGIIILLPISLHARQWRGNTTDPRAQAVLPDRTLRALDTAVREWRGSGPVTDLRVTEDVRAVAAEELCPVREALERGPG
jgi:hypothetical protein